MVTLLLLKLLWLAVFLLSTAVSIDIYITPSTATIPCPQGKICMDLAQYSANGARANNTKLNFIPGEHILNSSLIFQQLENITLSGASASIMCSSKTQCSIKFDRVSNCTISNISFIDVQESVTFNNSKNVIMSLLSFSMRLNHTSNGALLLNSCETVMISKTHFSGYKAAIGAAVYIETSDTVQIINCSFANNSASTYGGAILSGTSTIALKSCTFTSNKATLGGGSLSALNSILSISESTFDHNTAIKYGGALYVSSTESTSYTMTINNSRFTNGRAISGGAITLLGGRSHIYNSSLSSNIADWSGGALYVYQSTLTIELCHMSENHAYAGNESFQNITYGGAMYIGAYSYVVIKESHLTDNIAQGFGGAVYSAINSSLLAQHSLFGHNYNLLRADDEGYVTFGGGALCVSGDLYVFNNCSFIGNKAVKGGAIFDYFAESIQLHFCVFDGNIAWSYGGALYTCELCHVLLDTTRFGQNIASTGAAIYSQGSRINSTGDVSFNNNSCETLAVVYLHLSEVVIHGDWLFVNNIGSVFLFTTRVTFKSKAIFGNNKQPSTYLFDEGGAITAIQGYLVFEGPTLFTKNQAQLGGAMFLSGTSLYATQTAYILMTNNTAFVSGGAIHSFQSDLMFGANTQLSGNRAFQNGGGFMMTGTTIKILTNQVQLSQNRAKHGGGMYLQENSMILIQKARPRYYPTIFLNFIENGADFGGAVFVKDETNSGVCDNNSTTNNVANCFLQVLSLYSTPELENTLTLTSVTFSSNNATYTGNSIFGGLLDRCTLSIFSELLIVHPSLNYPSALSALDMTTNINSEASPVSSHPVQVCFCVNGSIECNTMQPAIHITKGHTVKLSLVAVDQASNPTPANILALVSNIATLKEGQTNQTVSGVCTELEYNVYSPYSKEEMILYAEGPCLTKGISQQKITIEFEPCHCAIGFQPSNSSTECECICDKRLSPYITNCTSNQTINKENDVWVRYDKETGESGFLLYEFCPFDYCKSTLEGPVTLNLTHPRGADEQCAFNRSGKLCGSCQNGLSLAFGSSQCLKCTNSYLALLVAFALAGIALVVFLLVCNLTVATGSINGLVFYANIIIANRSVFLPDDLPAVFSVFIAWINLDLGIETCFYNGMDTYAKSLLQLVFPAYVLTLVISLIVISERSKRFTALIGKKNPVATLATLILLSCTKFLRIIITGLSFGHLKLPDGTWEMVWLPDANVLFLAKDHAVRFIVVSLIMAVGIVFITLLVFEKCLRKCSGQKAMKWLNNTKLHAFMDAYYAPYNPQHCYWVGLLLLVRIMLYLHAIGFNSEPTLEHKATMLAIIGTTFFLLLLKQLKVRIYKNWVIDSLETTFLINLGMFAAGTFHILSTKAPEKQLILAIISVSIALLTFLAICIYHTFTFVAPNSRPVICLRQLLHKCFKRPTEPSLYSDLNAIQNAPPYIALKPENEQQPVDSERNSVLREPYLDILAPLTSNDWLQEEMHQYRSEQTRPVTHTTIEGRPPRQAGLQ